MKKYLIFMFVLFLVGCTTLTSETTERSTPSQTTRFVTTEVSTTATTSNVVEESTDFYMVYTSKGITEENIYIGKDKESFRKVYTENTTFDICDDGRTYGIDSYSCLYIRRYYPYEAIRVGENNNFSLHLIDPVKNEYLHFDSNNPVIYSETTQEYEEIIFNDTVKDHRIGHRSSVVSHDMTGTKFLFRDQNYKHYYYNLLEDELIELRDGYMYYNLNREFDEFFGFTNNKAIYLKLNDFYNPKVFENINYPSIVGGGFISYYTEDNLFTLYNLDTEETYTLSIEPYTRVYPMGTKIVYLDHETFYVYDLNTRTIIDSVPNILEYHYDYNNQVFVLIGSQKVIWYSESGEQTEQVLDTHVDLTTDVPIITKDFIFFHSFIVHKTNGYVNFPKSKQDLTIAYIMSENRVFASYVDGTSYVITSEGFEELTWIKEKINN